MWDLIVSVPDHCSFFYLECILVFRSAMPRGVTVVCIYVPILLSLHL